MKISGHKTMAVCKRYYSFHVDDLTATASGFNTYFTLAHSAEESISPNLLNHRMCARSSGG